MHQRIDHAKTLVKRIAEKGGLMGTAAKAYLDSNEYAVAFLRECYEQCDSASVQTLWGPELVAEIRRFFETKGGL